jgi:transposase
MADGSAVAMRKGIEIEVNGADRARLEAIVADRNSPQKHVWRAQIILATADGCGTAAVMRRAGVAKPSVWRWQERFMAEGVDGLLHDKTRPARIPPLPKAVVQAVVTRTLDEAPPDEATHWTAPAMAAASGLSTSSVQRIWRAHGPAGRRRARRSPRPSRRIWDRSTI